MPDDFDPLANEADADEFYISNRADLLSYALSITSNPQDAEDAVHEAATRSYEYYLEHKRMCPPHRDPVGYMKIIIRNYLIDKYRHGQVEERALPELVPGVKGDIADEVGNRMVLEQVFAAMRRLRADAQQIARLYWEAGMSDDEIADQLGISASTVRSSISRTRKKLRKLVNIEE